MSNEDAPQEQRTEYIRALAHAIIRATGMAVFTMILMYSVRLFNEVAPNV